ncbi:hypothetical protein MMC30_007468 [Trapelia coarctata]|nr:hypothetical protein [Trapelia coarctata]
MISRRWMHRVEARKVHLRDLERYVFSYKYKPQLGPHGEHELCFRDSADATEFTTMIEALANKIADSGPG